MNYTGPGFPLPNGIVSEHHNGNKIYYSHLVAKIEFS